MKINCKCGATGIVSGGIGTARDIGWGYITCMSAKVFYVCPSCLQNVMQAAQLIKDYSDETGLVSSLIRQNNSSTKASQ